MNNKKTDVFRKHIEKTYCNSPTGCGGSFGEILCYEIHSQPVNPRMRTKTLNDGFDTGLTFRELAHKWGISCTFLGELILDHCRRLDKGGVVRGGPKAWGKNTGRSTKSRSQGNIKPP